MCNTTKISATEISVKYENLSVKSLTHRNRIYNHVMVTYVWIDASYNLRSKIRSVAVEKTHLDKPLSPQEISKWNYDGSSCGQTETKTSDLVLVPVFTCWDPFHPFNCSMIVLCDVVDSSNPGRKIPGINRRYCSDIASDRNIEDAVFWFAFEQEYVILDASNQPYGWSSDIGKMEPQGKYYCGVGTGAALGRHLADSFYHCMLYAGLHISGDNAEVMASQWEYQIGPVTSIEAADQLWVSRFILNRLAEEFNMKISLSPKVYPGSSWNGSGCHINLSTAYTRNEKTRNGKKENCMHEIYALIDKLAKKHQEHLEFYDLDSGKQNKLRLCGNCETSRIDQFSYGVSDRSASIRIPENVAVEGVGYIEDRRPAANIDPYLAIGKLMETLR